MKLTLRRQNYDTAEDSKAWKKEQPHKTDKWAGVILYMFTVSLIVPRKSYTNLQNSSYAPVTVYSYAIIYLQLASIFDDFPFCGGNPTLMTQATCLVGQIVSFLPFIVVVSSFAFDFGGGHIFFT